MNKKIILFAAALLILIGHTPSYGVQNTSLSRMLVKFRGDEFNLMIAKPNLVGVTNRKKKTRKAIKTGFENEIKNIRRLLNQKNMRVNMKFPNLKRSDTPQFFQIEKEVYKKLEKLIVAETDLHSRILEELGRSDSTDKGKKYANAGSTADLVNADDIDFDPDSMLDTTGETIRLNSINLSPEAIFNTLFLEIGELYARRELSAINQVRVPFKTRQGLIARKFVHSVFGAAFFPTTRGSIKIMRMYIFLFVVNTETSGSNIAFKEIKDFRWDRNEFYISAATSKVLRQIIAEVLGQPIR